MHRSIRVGFSVFALTAGIASVNVKAAPGDKPTAAPTVGAPATPEKKPEVKKLVMPPGFEKVTVGSHTALCEPNDVKWVTQALTDAKPGDKPQLAPSDLINNVNSSRTPLTKQMVEDLTADDKQVNAFLDEKVIGGLKKLESTRPPVFLLVTTQAKLKSICKNGWGEPRYHYNPVADAVAIDDSIPFSVTGEMDDTVLPALYADDDKKPEDRPKSLATGIQSMDTRLMAKVAEQGTPTVFTAFFEFIQDTQIKPLKLKKDQAWFGTGVANYLTAKYTGIVTKVDKGQLLNAMVQQPQGFPVLAQSVDLAKPMVDLTDPRKDPQIRLEFVPYYIMAMQRKSTLVVAVWLQEAGEQALQKTLVALKTKVPTDGPGLTAVIKEISGVAVDKYLPAQ